MAYSAGAGAGGNLDDLSSACTVSSSQCVAPYPYDVDVSSIATRTTNNNPVIRSFGGVRQFLCRTLKQVHFSGNIRSLLFPHLIYLSSIESDSFDFKLRSVGGGGGLGVDHRCSPREPSIPVGTAEKARQKYPIPLSGNSIDQRGIEEILSSFQAGKPFCFTF